MAYFHKISWSEKMATRLPFKGVDLQDFLFLKKMVIRTRKNKRNNFLAIIISLTTRHKCHEFCR